MLAHLVSEYGNSETQPVSPSYITSLIRIIDGKCWVYIKVAQANKEKTANKTQITMRGEMIKFLTEMTELKKLLGKIKNLTGRPHQQIKGCRGQNQWTQKWAAWHL